MPFYHGVAFTGAVISFILSVYATIRTGCDVHKFSSAENLVRRPIFNLFFCDVIWNIREMTTVGPALFYPVSQNPWNQINPQLCTFIAAVAQVGIIGIAFWSLVIDWMLCMVLIGFSSSQLTWTAQYQFVFVWGCAAISSAVGVGIDVFGPVSDTDADCGVPKPIPEFIFHIIPLIISLTTSIIALCMAIYRHKLFRGSNRYILRDVTLFTSAYVVVWIIPVTRRTLAIFFPKITHSKFLLALYEILPCSQGLLDFIIWFRLSHTQDSTLTTTYITESTYSLVTQSFSYSDNIMQTPIRWKDNA